MQESAKNLPIKTIIAAIKQQSDASLPKDTLLYAPGAICVSTEKEYMRRACCAPIEFDKDGLIHEVIGED